MFCDLLFDFWTCQTLLRSCRLIRLCIMVIGNPFSRLQTRRSL